MMTMLKNVFTYKEANKSTLKNVRIYFVLVLNTVITKLRMTKGISNMALSVVKQSENVDVGTN